MALTGVVGSSLWFDRGFVTYSNQAKQQVLGVLASTLDTRGELHPVQTATLFKETLGDDLEASAGRMARLAIEQARTKNQRDDRSA